MFSVVRDFFENFLRKNTTQIVLMWLVVILGVILRAHRGDSFPISNNDDGLIYTWAGVSQFEDPTNFTSLTIFDQDNEYILWRSQYKNFIPHQEFGMKIVRPWFDHPPLGVLMIGTVPHLLGYDQIEQLPHMIVRFSALFASILTMVLTFKLTQKLFDKKTAFLALIFLATIPYFVFAQRQAYLENIMNPIFLGALCTLFEYLRRKKGQQKNKYFIATLGLSLLLGWMKITGFTVPFMIAGWLLVKKDFKAAGVTIVANLVSLAGYILYGLIINRAAFLQLIQHQAQRGAFVSSFFDAATKIGIYEPLASGWYLLGLISAIFLMLGLSQRKKHQAGKEFFSWFFLAWLIVLFMTSGEFNNSPWYRYPLIPFMSMAIGYFVKQVWQTGDIFKTGVLFLLGLTGLDLIKLELNSSLVRLATLSFFGVLALNYFFESKLFKSLAKVVVRFFVISLVVLNLLVVSRYYSVVCNQEHHCLTPTKIRLDENLEKIP